MPALTPCYATLLPSDGVTGPGVSLGVMNGPVATLGFGLSSQAADAVREPDEGWHSGLLLPFPPPPQGQGTYHCAWRVALHVALSLVGGAWKQSWRSCLAGRKIRVWNTQFLLLLQWQISCVEPQQTGRRAND